ncbi:MAG TPA: tetratricopeptide repeat protein [Candidatus Binatia bacterium]|jgi:tetratricopeptide (TPR) repeat protein
MKTGTALAIVFVASVAAGAWLLGPRTAAEQPRTSCGGGSCDAPAGDAPPIQQSSRQDATAHAAAPSSPAAPRPHDGAGREPVDSVLLRQQADAAIANGDLAQGLEKMKAATAADPSARNHGDYGDLLEKLTDFDGAIRELRAAADLEPGNADRWIALANAYYLKVDPGEAWKAEGKAREAEPGLVLGRAANGLRIRKGDSAAAPQ